MHTILHISDLHFGPPYVPRVGDSLLAIAPSINPDVIVASGDFTQRAKPEQFAAARKFLDQLPAVPQLVVPGNHDVPLFRIAERLFRPYANYRKYISDQLNQEIELDGLKIVGLDSTAPRSAISNGRVHKENLAFCRRALQDTSDDTCRIVVAHHHFAPAPDYERDKTMPQARRAMNEFVDLGVEIIFGGHLHRAYVGNSLDFYPGNHRDRGIIIVQSGTTTSRRGRGKEKEKNSFNVIQVDDHMVYVTHYMFFENTESFLPLSRHIFPRPGKQFVEPTLEI